MEPTTTFENITNLFLPCAKEFAKSRGLTLLGEEEFENLGGGLRLCSSMMYPDWCPAGGIPAPFIAICKDSLQRQQLGVSTEYIYILLERDNYVDEVEGIKYRLFLYEFSSHHLLNNKREAVHDLQQQKIDVIISCGT